MNKAICLHIEDNVCVALSDLKAGETIYLDDFEVELQDPVLFGHKVALKSVKKGESIIKYGVSIGVATAIIQKGSHVHTQNMESLYMKQFTK